MKIVIAGGAGFIGSKMTQRLLESNHQVIVLSRREMPESISCFLKNAKLKWLVWDGRTPEVLVPVIDGASAVLNFAGESIAGKRWTDVQKTKIFESRIGTTKSLVSAIGNAGHPPKVPAECICRWLLRQCPGGRCNGIIFKRQRFFGGSLCTMGTRSVACRKI